MEKKYWIDQDLGPTYTLYLVDSDTFKRKRIIELTDKEFEDYTSASDAYYKWQNTLGDAYEG